MILFDTAGQEDYASLRPMMHNIANIFVICFNVDNESSFRNIQTVWLPEASGFNKTASIVICACKVDLRYGLLNTNKFVNKNNQRIFLFKFPFSTIKDSCIETGQVRTLCKELKLPFVECSAKENTNVQEVFECIKAQH